MARPFELSSNSSDIEAAIFYGKMARLEGETSNALFETLADWDHQLKAADIDFQEPQP